MGRFVSDNDIIDSGNPGAAISFDDVLNTPTTLAGYGITDGALANNIEFNNIVNRPSTFLGYGITDGVSFDVLNTTVNNAVNSILSAGGTDVITEAVNTAVSNALLTGDIGVITDAVNAAVTSSFSEGGLAANTFVNKTGGDTLTGDYIINGSIIATGGIIAFSNGGTGGGTTGGTGGTGTVIDTSNLVSKTGGDTLTGDYGITGNLSATGTLDVGGVLTTTTNATVGGDLSVTGNMVAQGDVTGFSDERFKKDWIDLPENFVEQLSGVKHGNYTRIDSEKQQVGVSAQSLQSVLPNAVLTDNDNHLSVAYGNAALVAAIELAKEVVSLKKTIADLVLLVNQKSN